MSACSRQRPSDRNCQPSSRTIVPRAMPPNSALRSRAQFRKPFARATPKPPDGSWCQVVLMHSHRSSGMTSRARRALSRAAAQQEKIELGSRRSYASRRSRSACVGSSTSSTLIRASRLALAWTSVELSSTSRRRWVCRQAGGVLGALDVAPDPEHRLRDAAEDHRRPSPVTRSGVLLLLLLLLPVPGVREGDVDAGAADEHRDDRRTRFGRDVGAPVVRRRPCRRGRPSSARSSASTASALVDQARDRRAQHPGVLAAAALAAVDHQLALGQRDAGQPAGQHVDAVAVVDREGAQVDVAGPQRVVDQGRARSTAGRPAGRSSRAGRR